MIISDLIKGRYYRFESEYYFYYFKFKCISPNNRYKNVVSVDYYVNIDKGDKSVIYGEQHDNLIGAYNLRTLISCQFVEISFEDLKDYIPDDNFDKIVYFRNIKIKSLLNV